MEFESSVIKHTSVFNYFIFVIVDMSQILLHIRQQFQNPKKFYIKAHFSTKMRIYYIGLIH